jgi:hypothetical protein
MKSRDKVMMALDHTGSDAVPVDFGATAVTGMHVSVVAALRQYCGLDNHPVKVVDPYQMLGTIEEDLIAALGIDTAGVIPRSTMFGVPFDGWKEWKTPWGQEVLVPRSLALVPDANGDILTYPEGDTACAASGRMPRGGYFFDTIVRQEPIDEDALDAADNLEEFAPIGAEDLAWFKTETERAAATGRAVVATFGGTAFGDIALVPGPFMKHPRGIRDIAEWYMSTAIRKDYVHAIFEGQCAIALENLRTIHQTVGNAVDVVFVCGTDFGTQQSTFCSAEAFDDLYAPYYVRVNRWIHEHTTWKTFKHSCGAVEPFMGRFIDCGFDIVNPVQCSAAGMDPRVLKERYGERLTFWGGGVDTQKTLPFGTPDEVRTQVLERCEVFSRDGGFVFNAIHNIQANSPVENVAAMFDAVREFNGKQWRNTR